jgi:predicted NACHT family NTPase
MSVRGQQADPFPGRQYDTWREGVQRLEYAYEEHPEAQVLREIQQGAATSSRRFWLILGEPGAGKTTLLEAWFRRWAAQLQDCHLGMVVPVLVRLRYMQAQETLQDSEKLADRLWDLGLNEQALLEGQGEHVYRLDGGLWFRPVWLLDGLDEVVPPPDERFYQAIVNLPGVKVLT